MLTRSNTLPNNVFHVHKPSNFIRPEVQIITQQVRFYAEEAEEEIDEEEKAKREKLAKLQQPTILPGMVPRRRSTFIVNTM